MTIAIQPTRQVVGLVEVADRHVDVRAVEGGGVVRRQEHDRPGHFLRRGHPADRRALSCLLGGPAAALAEPSDHWGVHYAGGDRRDPDVVPGVLECRHPGQAEPAVVADDIRAELGERLEPALRADVNDHPPTTVAGLGEQLPEFVLDAEELPGRVRVEDVAPRGFRHLVQPGVAVLDASVVERDVEPAVLGHRSGDERLDLFLDADVGVVVRQVAAVGPHFSLDLLAELLAAAVEYDLRPLHRKGAGGRLADAARAAGDEHDLVLKAAIGPGRFGQRHGWLLRVREDGCRCCQDSRASDQHATRDLRTPLRCGFRCVQCIVVHDGRTFNQIPEGRKAEVFHERYLVPLLIRRSNHAGEHRAKPKKHDAISR